jgi:hypothetical protein
MMNLTSVQLLSGSPAPVPATAAKSYPSIMIKGEYDIKLGKNTKYEAVTDAVDAKYKWEIVSPEGNVKIATTRTIILNPDKAGSYNLTLTVTDNKGNSNEMVLTVTAKK